MSKNGYEILQFSLCEGWINNLFDGNDKPYVFTTLEEAIAELQEEFDDWQAEIESGSRRKDEGYDICTFRIICNETGIVYELDMLDDKLIAPNGFTYN